jgi:hypothetical protein
MIVGVDHGQMPNVAELELPGRRDQVVADASVSTPMVMSSLTVVVGIFILLTAA